jgi:hypothetical protein
MAKKQKRKPTAAQRQLTADWEALLAKHAKPLERGATSKGLTPQRRAKRVRLEVAPSTVTVDPARDLRRLPSAGGIVGSTAKKESVQYTGTKMLGIGVMHKSNSVPIFSEDEAIEISTMRRN